ncbi:NAD(P)H nitroreductase [Paractinoplanes ferrugineus]|uniref:NAD(P)H nitroreductase n=1 Tax=Paractinoplanes ferrugineus TaxID=113564 RepID=A0A919MHS5_9ACTN|nr:nitroreductase family protein [Actinoplanes ferrugineus]GIE12945.1 NAD(P)H nitroreductase [Actinoplanes ferrugineus]
MTTTIVRPARKVLTGCVRAATAAPSLHNSQPWRFRIDGPTIEVYADPGRRLHVIDPFGREQLMSVGAAIFTLRLAIRQAGYRTDSVLFPWDDVVARVTAVQPADPNPAVEALCAAIEHRHTNRWPFARSPVPLDALDRLVDAARREGTALRVAGPVARDAILGLAQEADRRLHDRPGYRAELARWTGDVVRDDGVPARVAGPWDALRSMPVRDFPHAGRAESFEPHPTLLVLATRDDNPADWVRAGQALQRVLLTATWLGLATAPISQPVEVPAVREVLGRNAQLVLRVGYGRRLTGSAPRRPVSDVLDPAH